MPIKHTIRVDGFGKTKTVNLTARTAILFFCKECVSFDYDEVKSCTSKLCPLYPFRNKGAPEETIFLLRG